MPKYSIIIPVYNEEKSVLQLLERVISQSNKNWEREVIVVDDGSTDGSLVEIERIKKYYNLKLIQHAKNLGKGAAVKSALREVTGDFVLIQDADLEYDPKDYPVLLKEAEKGADVVYGSRNLGSQERGYFLYYLGGRLISALFNFLYGTNLTDINTGYKLIKRGLLCDMLLRSNGFEFCEEVTARLIKSGNQIKEIPISYKPRPFHEGKKIRWHDGVKGIWTVIKYRMFNN
jgi:glycosyltransferase involved in cell wall biosynthesis